MDKLTIKFKRNSYESLDNKSEVKKKMKSKDGMINASIRKILNTRINPYVFFTPLEILDFILTLKIDPIVVKAEYNRRKVTFRFHINFMNYKLEPDNSNIAIAMSYNRQI